MPDDPAKEPSDAPGGTILAGAGALSTAGQIGLASGVVVAGVGAFTLSTTAEVNAGEANLPLQAVIVLLQKDHEGTAAKKP
jgi:hypothetical protein